MDQTSSEDLRHGDAGIAKLEEVADTADLNIDQLLKEYRVLYAQRPLWRLVEDIIELLKQGQSAQTIREKMEELGLVPPGKLPNPNVPALLTKALNKIAQYRRALVEIIKRYGGEILNEMEFETGLTISVGVAIGFPPAVTIAVERTATTQTITRF
jgi:hypothetical protein